jgi:hypothetical protein
MTIDLALTAATMCDFPDGSEPDPSCSCPNPDDQYTLEIDNGSVLITHRACGKTPAGDWNEVLVLDALPVTVRWERPHPCWCETGCDCDVYAVLTANHVSVMHDGVPYLVNRAYADTDGALWHISDHIDHHGNPLVYLLPQGSGEPAPLGQIVSDYGPLTLTNTPYVAA